MDDATKFQRLVQFRVPDSLSDTLDAVADKNLQSKSEYVRRSVIAALRADGFDPAAIPAREAGTLYDSLNGSQRYALITPAGAILAMSYHEGEPEPDPQERGVWLPVVHEDSEPFDIASHWRLAPMTTIEPDRVVVTFPVVPKSLEAV